MVKQRQSPNTLQVSIWKDQKTATCDQENGVLIERKATCSSNAKIPTWRSIWNPRRWSFFFSFIWHVFDHIWHFFSSFSFSWATGKQYATWFVNFSQEKPRALPRLPRREVGRRAGMWGCCELPSPKAWRSWLKPTTVYQLFASEL